MAKTIVGLFDERDTAKGVRDTLKKDGLDDRSIHTAFHGEDLRKSEFFGGDDLADSLSNRGVPEDEAILYGEGVRRGGHLVVARVDDDKARSVADVMNRHQPVNMDHRSRDWREQGWKGDEAGAAPLSNEQVTQERDRYREHTARELAEKEEQVPVIEEEVRVGKRQVDHGGVKVHAHVEEHPVEEKVRLREETVEVERRDTDRELSAQEADRAFQEQDVEMRERKEEPVVEKEARQKGEVVVRKSGETRTETVRDTVRRTEVDVDETEGTRRASSSRFEDLRGDFRKHHDNHYGSRSDGFETYEPAYRHGHRLASDEPDGDWKTVEPEARRSYEERHGKGTFDQVKDAIRHAFDRSRSHSTQTSTSHARA